MASAADTDPTSPRAIAERIRDRARRRRYAPTTWDGLALSAIRAFPGKPALHRVALALADRGRGKLGGYAQIGYDDLAARAGVHKASAIRAVAQLVEGGLIEWEERAVGRRPGPTERDAEGRPIYVGRANRYRLPQGAAERVTKPGTIVQLDGRAKGRTNATVNDRQKVAPMRQLPRAGRTAKGRSGATASFAPLSRGSGVQGENDGRPAAGALTDSEDAGGAGGAAWSGQLTEGTANRTEAPAAHPGQGRDAAPQLPRSDGLTPLTLSIPAQLRRRPRGRRHGDGYPAGY